MLPIFTIAKMDGVKFWNISFLTIGLIIGINSVSSTVLSSCKSQCENTLNATTNKDLICDSQCRIESCSRGCELYDNTTTASCNNQCNLEYNGTEVQYCQDGCEFGLQAYADAVFVAAGDLEAPIPSSITGSSVMLQWTGSTEPQVTYSVEWRYTNLQDTSWKVYNSQPISATTETVSGLYPFTYYAFRIKWIFISSQNSQTTPETQTVTTLASGVPIDAPILTNLLSSSPSTISVSWQPVIFPAGTLVSYLVEATASNSLRAEVGPNVLSHTFTSLEENTMYTVTVAAVNGEGAGPKSSGNVTTLTSPQSSDSPAFVIVGVTRINVFNGQVVSTVDIIPYDMDQDFTSLHQVETNTSVVDVAVFYNLSSLYLSDTEGNIWQKDILVSDFEATINETAELLFNSATNKPTRLDVDWLNEVLYYVQGDSIMRCDIIMCDKQELVIGGLVEVPSELKVDPINGYLFWSDISSGIYRLDLAYTGTEALNNREHIVQLTGIGSFTVDSTALDLIYPNASSNEIMIAFIDGTLRESLRPPDVFYTNVTNLVFYDGLLRWSKTKPAVNCIGIVSSTGSLYYEVTAGTHEVYDRYFCPKGYGLELFHPSAQPTPVPYVAPMDLQVLFTESTADISWSPLSEFDEKGDGAWRSWLYEVEVTTVGTSDISSLDGIPETTAEALRLDSYTEYAIRVRAYSDAGVGPWSVIASGRTFIAADPDAFILIATDAGLQRMDLDGNNSQIINDQVQTVSDLAWYDDYAFWISEDETKVLSTSLSTFPNTPSDLSNSNSESNFKALAVDWLAEVLYWSDTRKRQINRQKLDLSNNQLQGTQERILQFVEARDIGLDSVNAFIYWSEETKVEFARINGDNQKNMFDLGDFSADQVAGLTLDLVGGKVYWFVVTFSGGSRQLELYSAPLAHVSSTPSSVKVSSVDSNTEVSTMYLYSRKFFWLDDAGQLIVSDEMAQPEGVIPSARANEVAIVQSTLQPYPDGFSSINPPNVIPDPIPDDDIVIDGAWDNFNVTWSQNVEVTHGDVFYEFALVADDLSVSQDTTRNFYLVTSLEPYTNFEVRILPYTYWQSAVVTTATLTSPESVPSVPQNPRLFVIENFDPLGNSSFTMEFRWSAVEKRNGVLLGYEVLYGEDQNDLQLEQVTSSMTFTVQNVKIDTTLYFKVRGYTKIGSGPETTSISGSTAAPNPPPTVLTVGSGTGITKEDLDTGDSVKFETSSTPVAVTYDAEQDLYYYADASGVYRSTHGKLVDITQRTIKSTAFSFDWIAQRLYWSEGPNIYALETGISTDVQPFQKELIDRTSGDVDGLVISPFGRKLIWAEKQTDNNYQLKVNDLSSSLNNIQSCNCEQQPTVAPAIALDSTNETDVKIYYVNASTSDIWVADSAFCSCSLVFESSSVTQSGLPPSFLSVDSQRIYWTNTNLGLFANVKKTDGSDFQSEDSEARIALTYNGNLQPFPAPECLTPTGPLLPPSLTDANTFKDSLILELAGVTPPPQCNSVSFATPVYTVRYAPIGESSANCTTGLNCTENVGTETQVQIDGLDPYTDYAIEVQAENFYSNGQQLSSPSQIYKTWVGLPSQPQNVVATVLTNSEIIVTWLEPENPSGPTSGLVYGFEATLGAIGEQQEGNVAQFNNLQADTSYDIQVTVRQQAAKEVDVSTSDSVTATTFMIPSTVQEITVSPVSITVNWTSPSDGSVMFHRIQHQFDRSDVWFFGSSEYINTTGSIATSSGVEYSYIIEDLYAYSYYNIRVQVQYTSGRWFDNQNNMESVSILTEADVPEQVTVLTTTSETVQWEAPNARGPGTLRYTLQAKLSGGSRRRRAFEDWTTVYTGTGTSWTIVDLTENQAYNFRVAAANDLGMGSFSPQSEELMVLPPPSSIGVGVIIGIVVVLVVLTVVVIILVFCFLRSRHTDEKKNFHGTVHYHPDQELATLRDYPNTISGENNRMYALTKTADGKEVQLPTFPRERLKLASFLGSGAFGEVYEGVAMNIYSPSSGQTKVAVKTLREGSTDQEKEEFLKEAILMNNFHHANIISLLGVCLNNDPHFIILELMSGGDLLNYLRNARETPESPAKLREVDLVDMLVDISRGCKYLEELHFVHRDLAARNCLVSCKGYDDPTLRIVKIGDFGLARDIYKSDYYRKEGEGLLPVRWMAPEALIDGLFTNASDIWAFGVLVWEVMTFGQQPYPARTNIEVLQYVSDGGRLDRPDNCPDDVYDMMAKCWEKIPKDRPSFLSILDRIENFKRKSYRLGYENNGFCDDEERVKYSQMQNTITNDDYLEPMDSKEVLKRSSLKPAPLTPPDLDIPPEKVRSPRDAKKDNVPPSPRPHLDAALENATWQKNKTALDDRYTQLPVGRSASSVSPASKPGTKEIGAVSRGGSVNIPTRNSGAYPLSSGSKKRQAPTSPQSQYLVPDMPPSGEAPKPPAPGGQPLPQSRSSSSQIRTDPSAGNRTGSQNGQKALSNQNSNNSQSYQNGGASAAVRFPNPFRKYDDEEDGDSNVEIYNV